MKPMIADRGDKLDTKTDKKVKNEEKNTALPHVY